MTDTPNKGGTTALSVTKGGKPLAVPNISADIIVALQSADDIERAWGVTQILGLVFPQLEHDKVLNLEERNSTRNAMNFAFKMAGGVDRLSLYADQNYDKFFPIWARTTSEAAHAPPGQGVSTPPIVIQNTMNAAPYSSTPHVVSRVIDVKGTDDK